MTIIDTKYLYQELSVTGDFTGDFIPKGKIYYNTGKIVPEYKNTWLSGLENEYTIWDHYDIARLTSNSCFLDGRAGINSTCFKSHEVATKVNDCLMINFVSWDPERTELK